MDIKKEYERWLANATADADVVAELKSLDDAKIEDAFYRDLAFGTGGLRGVIGAGTNRMNVYTVAKASQGLADYLKKKLCRAVRCHRLRQPPQERCVCKGCRRGVCREWRQGEYLACFDAYSYRVLCDPLSAHLCRCHGDGFPQSQQVQRL